MIIYFYISNIPDAINILNDTIPGMATMKNCDYF